MDENNLTEGQSNYLKKNLDEELIYDSSGVLELDYKNITQQNIEELEDESYALPLALMGTVSGMSAVGAFLRGSEEVLGQFNGEDVAPVLAVGAAIGFGYAARDYLRD